MTVLKKWLFISSDKPSTKVEIFAYNHLAINIPDEKEVTAGEQRGLVFFISQLFSRTVLAALQRV